MTMSDSDPLTEALSVERGRHAAITDINMCSCGVRLDLDSESNDWDVMDVYHAHLDRNLAAAARAFIGDEIAARSGAEKARYPGWDSHSSGYLYALDIAESIARGDTE